MFRKIKNIRVFELNPPIYNPYHWNLSIIPGVSNALNLLIKQVKGINGRKNGSSKKRRTKTIGKNNINGSKRIIWKKFPLINLCID